MGDPRDINSHKFQTCRSSMIIWVQTVNSNLETKFCNLAAKNVEPGEQTPVAKHSKLLPLGLPCLTATSQHVLSQHVLPYPVGEFPSPLWDSMARLSTPALSRNACKAHDLIRWTMLLPSRCTQRHGHAMKYLLKYDVWKEAQKKIKVTDMGREGTEPGRTSHVNAHSTRI